MSRRKTKYLPPICWVGRDKCIPELERGVDEGMDYCPACVKIVADKYRARFPKHTASIYERGGQDNARESDSPAMCCECCQPLACVVVGTDRWLNTEAQWMRHP